MSATPRRRSSREKLFKAFYCFSGSEADHGVVRTVAKYKPPSSSVAATVIGTGSSSSSGHSPPTSYEPEQVQDTAVALLCLPDGLQRLHDRPLQGVPQDELFHTFVITQETGHRLFGSALRVWEPIVCSEHIHNPDSNLNLQCYQNKALCLLTAMPLVVASNRILRHIWSNNCSIELIQLICSIPVPITSRFVRVRLPHLGRRRTSSITSTSATDRSNRSDRQGESTVTLSIDQSELFIYGGLSSLPIFDYPLRYLFAHVLQPDQFVRLFAAVLLEQRILITSQRHLPLMLVAESLTNLLRPFAWQHVYVPILPSRLGLHYLDAPTPYIMGIVCPAESESDSDSPGLSIATTDSGSSPIASAHWRFDCDQKKLHVQPQLPNEVDLMLQSIKRQDSNTDFPLSMESDSSIIDEQLSPFLIELQNLIQRTMDEWRPSCSCMPQPDQMWNELNEFHAVSNHSQCDSNTWNTNAVHLKGSADSEHLIEEQRFNHTLRAVMYRHLQRYLLHQHERYIQLARIDTVKFDAVSFLCDQPAADRPFLARFIQTQMFASLIDESGRKLQTQLSAGSGAAACDDSSIFVIVDTDELNECNEINLPSTDSTHLLQSFHEAKLLDLRTLATEPIGSTTTATSSIHNNGTGTITPTIDRIRAHRSHHNHHSQQQHSPFKVCMSPIRSVSKSLQCTSTNKNTMEGKTDAFAAQTHGRVIDSLLKEAKVKTKRIVMDCMRDEKRSPNDGNISIEQEEQNMQVASLCDLIQRIWSHGRSNELISARCPFWHHLISYVNSSNQVEAIAGTQPLRTNGKRKPSKPDSMTAFEWMKRQLEFSNSGKALNQSPLASPIRALLRSAIHQNGSDPPPTKNSTSESNSVRCDVSKSQLSFGPPCTLAFDVASIQSLSEINTDVGRSRAFIRLCLQRRLLSSHLRTLLSDRLLLTRYYRKHAFLRSEDEREQFLTYLLTLSTVRLRSFSALYGNCSLRHRLFVHGSVPFAGQITVLLHSPNSPIQHCFGPPAQTQHTFHARSLVHPMCMWLRVDPQIKCFVHTVFLINEITGQSYKFECGRWFGKGVEDGAIERLLIAESIQAQKIADLVQKSDVSRGYSIGRHWNRFWTLSDQIPATDQLPDLIGQAVNLLCRACIYDSAGSKSDSNGITCEVFTNRALFDLLLGETQILATFAAIFHDGFRCKSSRYSFRPSDHLWDVLVRNRTTGDSAADDTDSEHFSASIGKLLQRIDEQAATLSKEDRVRLLVLICLRDHLLLSLFRSMLRSRCLSTHYDTGAFLRQSSTSNFLEQVLSPLQHIRLQLPPEITKGI